MKRLLSATMGLAGTTFFAAAAHAQDIANPVASWERLWHEVILDITVIGTVFFIAAVVMLVKYKASSPEQVGNGPKLSTAQSIAWALIPASIFMADDFFLAANGWTVWNDYRRVPENAMEIKMTAYQWYFEFEYPNGVVTDFTCSDDNGDGYYNRDKGECYGEGMVVPQGQPVVFRMTSEDVIHSFGIPEYRVKEDVMPGRTTYVWINPVNTGESVIQCAEFCGIDHSQMASPLHVVAPSEYDAWMAAQEEEQL